MVAVAGLNEESLMDKRELNYRYRKRLLKLMHCKFVLLDRKPSPSVCGNLSQFLTVRS